MLALRAATALARTFTPSTASALASGRQAAWLRRGIASLGGSGPKIAFFDFKNHERPYFEDPVRALKASRQVRVQFYPVRLEASTVALARDCKVVCVFVNDKVNEEVLQQLHAQGCRMIALRCAGFNNVDVKAAAGLGIAVARVPSYSPYAVAEHAAALLMAVNRKLPQAYNRFKLANFSLDHLVGFDLHGKTVGVVGTGKIGECFSRIMLGFGCQVLLYDVRKNPALESLPGCRYVELDELFANSRVISLNVPLFPSTKYLINKDSLSKMQRGVVIINTSRGALINTAHLIEALKTGQVGGAGLDVYEEEEDYFFQDRSGEIMMDDILARLMSFPNVIITGHQAFLTAEALSAIAETTLDNISQFLDGKKPLANAV
ncbi:uncharacterized protein BJ171DRAFT_251086 [Polychytrium aggregatum]|uniref:uncharacterized protein n=1 Tax=Polychytrium aggregatum TaxID=110093 RepID=UPI0022FE8013|nr:uncharacterized protein BJ171DRAFT_251086 [Polychytrium aggregatum]KAI9193551.1 hypothetical protein BJ171DRAFT_251086 [Polychytrium aggregatum]